MKKAGTSRQARVKEEGKSGDRQDKEGVDMSGDEALLNLGVNERFVPYLVSVHINNRYNSSDLNKDDS
jgi:hypothetical protein